MKTLDKYEELIATQANLSLAEKASACEFFRQNGFLSDAIQWGRKLVSSTPDLAALHANLASSYVAASQYVNASMHFSRALEASRRQNLHLRNYAIHRSHFGEIDVARKLLEEVIFSDPNDTKAIRILCARIRDIDPDWALGLINSARKNVSDLSGISELLWAEYQVREREGDFSRAYACLKDANEIKFKLLGYDIKEQAASFERVREVFASVSILNYRLKLGGDLVSEKISPLFICGMPRSGSTIIEKVLEHYFDITSVGEVETAQTAAQSIKIGMPVSQALKGLRNYYLIGLRDIIPAQKFYFVDKSLFNIRTLGFLLLAFPNACAVIPRRDRRDIIWSNYQHYFSGSELGYSFDWGALVSYIELVERYTEFWLELFPDRIIRVDNSELVDNPFGTAEKVKHNLMPDLKIKTKEDFVNPKTPSSTASFAQIYGGLRHRTGSYKNYLNYLPDRIFHG